MATLPKIDPLPIAPSPDPAQEFTKINWQRWLLSLSQGLRAVQRALLFDSAGLSSYKLASGSGTTDGTGLLTVTFPSAFGSAPIVTACAVLGAGGAASVVASVSGTSLTQVQIYSRNQTGALLPNAPVTWIAVGPTS